MEGVLPGPLVTEATLINNHRHRTQQCVERALYQLVQKQKETVGLAKGGQGSFARIAGASDLTLSEKGGPTFTALRTQHRPVLACHYRR